MTSPIPEYPACTGHVDLDPVDHISETVAEPAPHELANGVLLAIRIEAALDQWINDDTARSIGEAITDELATPAGRERIRAFYAELDGGE